MISPEALEDSRSSVECQGRTLTSEGLNVTVTVGSECDENISFPSSSSSSSTTPIPTTPTREIPKQTGSPIMRGLQNVLNMFRSSQGPEPTRDEVSTSELATPTVSNAMESPSLIASTPVTYHKEDNRRSSPLKDSIVFNEELSNELQWNNDSTVIFSKEKIPIHKLFPQQAPYSSASTTFPSDSGSQAKYNDNLNISIEPMDISLNESIAQDKTKTHTNLSQSINDINKTYNPVNHTQNINVSFEPMDISYNEMIVNKTETVDNRDILSDTQLLNESNNNSVFLDCEANLPDICNETELLRSYVDAVDESTHDDTLNGNYACKKEMLKDFTLNDQVNNATALEATKISEKNCSINKTIDDNILEQSNNSTLTLTMSPNNNNLTVDTTVTLNPDATVTNINTLNGNVVEDSNLNKTHVLQDISNNKIENINVKPINPDNENKFIDNTLNNYQLNAECNNSIEVKSETCDIVKEKENRIYTPIKNNNILESSALIKPVIATLNLDSNVKIYNKLNEEIEATLREEIKTIVDEACTFVCHLQNQSIDINDSPKTIDYIIANDNLDYINDSLYSSVKINEITITNVEDIIIDNKIELDNIHPNTDTTFNNSDRYISFENNLNKTAILEKTSTCNNMANSTIFDEVVSKDDNNVKINQLDVHSKCAKLQETCDYRMLDIADCIQDIDVFEQSQATTPGKSIDLETQDIHNNSVELNGMQITEEVNCNESLQIKFDNTTMDNTIGSQKENVNIPIANLEIASVGDLELSQEYKIQETIDVAVLDSMSHSINDIEIIELKLDTTHLDDTVEIDIEAFENSIAESNAVAVNKSTQNISITTNTNLTEIAATTDNTAIEIKNCRITKENEESFSINKQTCIEAASSVSDDDHYIQSNITKAVKGGINVLTKQVHNTLNDITKITNAETPIAKIKPNDLFTDSMDFENMKNPFATKTKIQISPPNTPKMKIKNKLNFDEIEIPSATTNNIGLSPPLQKKYHELSKTIDTEVVEMNTKKSEVSSVNEHKIIEATSSILNDNHDIQSDITKAANEVINVLSNQVNNTLNDIKQITNAATPIAKIKPNDLFTDSMDFENMKNPFATKIQISPPNTPTMKIKNKLNLDEIENPTTNAPQKLDTSVKNDHELSVIIDSEVVKINNCTITKENEGNGHTIIEAALSAPVNDDGDVQSEITKAANEVINVLTNQVHNTINDIQQITNEENLIAKVKPNLCTDNLDLVNMKNTFATKTKIQISPPNTPTVKSQNKLNYDKIQNPFLTNGNIRSSLQQGNMSFKNSNEEINNEVSEIINTEVVESNKVKKSRNVAIAHLDQKVNDQSVSMGLEPAINITIDEPTIGFEVVQQEVTKLANDLQIMNEQAKPGAQDNITIDTKLFEFNLLAEDCDFENIDIPFETKNILTGNDTKDIFDNFTTLDNVAPIDDMAMEIDDDFGVDQNVYEASTSQQSIYMPPGSITVAADAIDTTVNPILDKLSSFPTFEITSEASTDIARNNIGMPYSNNDPPEPEEMFIDAASYDFLMNLNSNGICDNGKESLFLKFDPLCCGRPSGGIATGLKLTRRSPNKVVDTENTENSSMNETQDVVSEESFEDLNVTVAHKPTMAVMPAVNNGAAVQPQTSTPNRQRQSMTHSSPAIALIDRLLTISANNTPVRHDMTVTHDVTVHMGVQDDAEEALQQLTMLLAEKEETNMQLRSESRELSSRLHNIETQVKTLERENETKLKNINELSLSLAAKTKMNNNMVAVVKEFESTIAGLLSEIEQEKKNNAEEHLRLVSERDEQNSHLASMEVSFKDLHSKFEKCRQVILTYKANEDAYKKKVAEYEESLSKLQKNYELLKQHATAKLNNANQELEMMNRSHEMEVIKMNAIIKRKEMHISSIEESITQKTKANDELTKICDEILNRVC